MISLLLGEILGHFSAIRNICRSQISAISLKRVISKLTIKIFTNAQLPVIYKPHPDPRERSAMTTAGSCSLIYGVFYLS